MNLDKITLERINTAHPKIRVALLEQYKEVSALLPSNVVLRFAYVYRSPEEQAKLFKQRPKVTNANAWQSIHNYSLAFDIVLIIDGKASWNVGKEWKMVAEFFKSKGWEYGGDWSKFKDYPHFQMSFGLTWQQMKAKIDSGKFTIDNGIKYIDL
jgi:peptidoglycan L-alanyl-D-glutamate endopeptidase CwlK